MCDYVERFLELLEPLIKDYDLNLNELEDNRKKYESFSNFLDYVDNDVKKICTYDNQDFILDKLSDIVSDEKEYNAACYLINTDIDEIKKLPQYKNASDYMKNVLKYFTKQKSTIYKKVDELSTICDIKRVEKKYYDLFKEDKALITDIDECVDLIKSLDIDNSDRISLIEYVVKNNVYNYKHNQNREYVVDKTQDMKNVQKVIFDNKNLFNGENDDLYDNIRDDVDLSLPIEKIITFEVLEKHGKDNVLLSKKMWLVRKINNAYKSCEFGMLDRYMSEYDSLENIKNQLIDITDSNEILKAMKGE